MKKKVISILLSTAMTAVLLAGCGDAAQETAAPEAKPAQQRGEAHRIDDDVKLYSRIEID